MNRNFTKLLSEVLKHEGGFVNHPNDPGAATNLGVTLANFRRYVKPGGSIADLKRLTTAQAGTVYRRHYWDKVHGAELPAGVDYAVFDFAINSGPSRAAKYLQEIVGVPVDGRIGPRTLEAVNNMLADLIVIELCENRLAFMKRIKNRKTGKKLWTDFGRGWQRRVDSVETVALSMIHGEISVTSSVSNKKGVSTTKPVKGVLTAIVGLLKALSRKRKTT